MIIFHPLWMDTLVTQADAASRIGKYYYSPYFCPALVAIRDRYSEEWGLSGRLKSIKSIFI